MGINQVPVVVKKHFILSNFLKTESKHNLISEIYKGLKAKQKYISSRFFYDENGSRLFEEITRLPEYYLTRIELKLLKAASDKIIRNSTPIDLIELGSGDCSKISILLDVIKSRNTTSNVRYIPIDVSEAAITGSAEILSHRYPGLKIHGFLNDFMKHDTTLQGNAFRLICFFGSTIGNLSPQQSISLLKRIKKFMKPGDQLLLGIDMVKEIDVIEAAYNDKQGITSSFNKNILNVVNNYAHTNFETDYFEHRAFYNKRHSRIEMHLVAKKDMTIESKYFTDSVSIKKGETIHTENSRKYTPNDIEHLSSVTGLTITDSYTDKNKWFSLVNFRL